MANTSATWQQATHTTYQLLSSSCSAKPNSEEKYFKKRGKSWENGPLAEKLGHKEQEDKPLGRKTRE